MDEPTKQIILLRHAKSDWDAQFDRDLDRPLSRRGLRDAPRMGAFLTKSTGPPDLVVTSPAVRTRETALLAAREGGWDCPVRDEPRLYLATPATLLEVLRELPREIGLVVAVGHEPTMSEALAALTGSRATVPTAALIRIDVDGAWSEIADGRGRLRWLVTPKILERAQS